jgi:hypothetical protein
LVADVVVVVGVVGEFDIDGPDSLGFGAADASAVAPMMTMPARQLVAKSLRIMIHTLFQAHALGAPTPWVRMASDIGFKYFAIQRAPRHLRRLSNCYPATNQMTRVNLSTLSVVVLDVKGCKQCVTQTERGWHWPQA